MAQQLLTRTRSGPATSPELANGDQEAVNPEAVPALRTGLARQPGNAHGPSRLTSATVIGLQGTVGNQVVARMVADHRPVQRKVIKIGAEQVEVGDTKKQETADKAEAKQIIKTIKTTYGVSLNSSRMVKALQEQYSDAPKEVRKGVQSAPWRMIELRALSSALEKYAPILGKQRGKSTRKGEKQEVTSVGKANTSIDQDEPTGKLDPDTLGEFFQHKKSMGLFQKSEGHAADFPDEKDQLVGTFVHEIAHGLLAYAIDDYVKDTDGFWTDEDTASGKPGAEAPITGYGTTNAAEDLCEAAMMYFVKPDRLKAGDGKPAGQPGNPAPKRFAFMEKVGKSWLPPVSKAPKIVKPSPPGTNGTGTKPGIKIGGHRGA